MTDGWDDPRMPTIAGLRRRGYTPESIRNFCREIGVSKAYSTVDSQMLEYFIRDDLSTKAEKATVVIDPLKVVITNYPENESEILEIPADPKDESKGTIKTIFSKRNLY